tara:strand:+ start:1468 stop:1656 length:189 start_codon:yes stop_codon:yes gene_type:complete
MAEKKAAPKKKAPAKSPDQATIQSCADRLASAAVTDFNGVASVVIPKVVLDDVVGTLKGMVK